MRHMPQQRLVLAACRLALGSVDDDDGSTAPVRDCPKLLCGWKASAAASAESTSFDGRKQVRIGVVRPETRKMSVEGNRPPIPTNGREQACGAARLHERGARGGHTAAPATVPV